MLQAAGWVEPDPFPIRVPALATGVIKELLVRESDAVKAGDPVALLIDDEAKIALEKAESRAGRGAGRARARGARAGATPQKSFDAALAVTENAAVTKALVGGQGRREPASRAATVAGGESDLQVAEEELAIQQQLAQADAAGHRAVELAEAKVRSGKAGARGPEGRTRPLAASEARKPAARARRAKRDLELRLDDRLAVDARAPIESTLAKAKVRTAEAARRGSRAATGADDDPLPGGGRRDGAGGRPGHVARTPTTPSTTIVCLLFDPAHIRIRVDVSQSDISEGRGRTEGRHPESRSAAQKPYRGEVVRIV